MRLFGYMMKWAESLENLIIERKRNGKRKQGGLEIS